MTQYGTLHLSVMPRGGGGMNLIKVLLYLHKYQDRDIKMSPAAGFRGCPLSPACGTCGTRVSKGSTRNES